MYPGIQVTKIKVMKKKLLLFFFSFLMLNVQAQFDNLLNKAKQKNEGIKFKLIYQETIHTNTRSKIPLV